MITTISILFYLKRAKVNAQGLTPIFQRITINGRRLDNSTGKYVDHTKWSVEMSKMKGNSEETRLINGHLENLKSKILNAEKELYIKDIPLNLESLKNILNGSKEQQRLLIPIFVEHNNRIKELLGIEYAPGTLERYQTSLNHTKDFLKWKYNITDIAISKIDFAFVNDYEFYLRSVKKCANNTAVKYIRNFNKIIKICLANDWLVKNPFANYKAKLKKVERVYLSEKEVQRIIKKDLKIDRLSLVRDIFIFSCFTGLAYVDVKNLTKSHINVGIDGNKWIFTHRQKTETASKIPILPVTQTIIDKYENHPYAINQGKLLPIMSNQKMNAYLKEIAAVCKINKDLTFHIARHTFATTVTLSNGVPIESVSKMLGHTNIKTTQHYAKILDIKVSQDMQQLKNIYTNKIFKNEKKKKKTKSS